MRLLHIHLLEARDLPSMDSNGLADPYCVLFVRGAPGSDPSGKGALQGEKLKTKTLPETLHPVFDQQITLDLPAWAEELVVDTFDFDRFSTDDFIGRAVVPLARAPVLTAEGGQLPPGASPCAGWFPLASLKESWHTVGSLFLNAVIDPRYLSSSVRESAGQIAAFAAGRNHAILQAEQRYFQAVRRKAQAAVAVAPAASAAASGLTASGSGSQAAGPSSSGSVSSLPLLDGGGTPLSIWIGTWNCGNAPPPDDLSPWIPLYRAAIYVVGTQECNYTPRRDNKSAKGDWQCALVRHFGRDYTLLKYHSLWEIRLAIFVRNDHLPHISNVCAGQEATGIGNVLGNKGGVATSFAYQGIKLCFLTSHLAAHQNHCEARNQNYRTIVRNLKLLMAGGSGAPSGGMGGGHDLLSEFHHVFWCGDLNYRLDFGSQGDAKSPPPALFEEMTTMIHSGRPEQLALLFDSDQLVREMEAQRAFVGFVEGDYLFPPTFKVKRNSKLQYTSQRSPAWCDRILRRSVAGFPVAQLSLEAAQEIGTSDHKPVYSFYEVLVPPTYSPLDRSLGAAMLRLHDLRCSGLRVFREAAHAHPSNASVGSASALLASATSPSASSASSFSTSAASVASASTGGGASTPGDSKEKDALAKELDPFLCFQAPFLSKAFVTPALKKTTSPQWLELPPVPLTYNNLSRLRSSLLHIHVCNKQSQDAVVGRATVGLRHMHAEGYDNEHDALSAALVRAHAAAEAQGTGAELTPAACADLLSPSSAKYAYKGLPHTLHFEAPFTFAGVQAGTISGSISVVWKARTDRK